VVKNKLFFRSGMLLAAAELSTLWSRVAVKN
jgi:hypothetical protein